MSGTILLGIDVESASESSRRYAEYGTELLQSLGVTATFYLTGRTLAMYPQVFAALENDQAIDLQCHTYDHLLFKTVFMHLPPGVRGHDDNPQYLVKSASPAQIEDDLARCGETFQQVLGRRPRGLTGPWGYYRGLQDRPDLLEIIHRQGFRYLRTFARDERDCQPVPLGWQPFFYQPQGFPDVLELLIHDYQDDYYWQMFARPAPGQTYAAHMKEIACQVAEQGLVWSICSHDHNCETREGFNKKREWLEPLIVYAKDIGIRFLTATGYYEEALKAKGL